MREDRYIAVTELIDLAAERLDGYDFTVMLNGDEYARGIIELLVDVLGLTDGERWVVARLIGVNYDAERDAVVV